MVSETIAYGMSTDTIGRFGSLSDLSDVTPTNAPAGREVVAWWPAKSLLRRVRRLEEQKQTVLELHGRMGVPFAESLGGKIRREIIAHQILDDGALAQNFSGYEWLFHAPEAGAFHPGHISNLRKASYVWIENDLGGESGMNKMIASLEGIRAKGIPSGGMFDIFHWMKGANMTTKREMNHVWSRMLTSVDMHSSYYIRGFHIPHGHPFDSIPDAILHDRAMLQDLAERIQPPIRHVVLEDQWPGRSSLKLSSVEKLRVRDRKYRMFERFREAGLLNT